MLDIGEVVKQSGLSASTLRYYEERGLIQSTARNGLRRQFAASVLDRLALIILGQQAGFSLDEIKTIFTSDGIEIDRAMLSSKADELDNTIRKLQTLSRGLRHAADCPAPSHLECPKFLRIMKLSKKKAV